jgi:hypothetical protein
MPSEAEERKRILGFPAGPNPYGPRDQEPRRYLGMRADWVGPVDVQWFGSLVHPLRSWRRWNRHRRLGPYALNDDDGAKTDGHHD